MNTTVLPPARPLAPAVFAGWQQGYGPLPSFRVYKLTEGIAGHPLHSIVSEKTLRAAGFAVVIDPNEPPAPPVGTL